MIKKLQSLLFEDEEDDYLDDEEEELVETEAPVQVSKPAVKPVSEPKPEPVVSKPVEVDDIPDLQLEPVVKESANQTKLNRIDVTANIPVAQPKQSAQVSFPEAPKAEPKKSSLGIIADDDYKAPKAKPVVQQIKPAKPKTQKPVKKADRASYEFQPVISPIFGVDEKDMTALKNTTKKVASMEASDEDDGNITPVISPIYGSTQAAVVNPVLNLREEAADLDTTPVTTPVSTPVEDEIPDFSLDDILKVRDEQYEEKDPLGDTAPLFPDLTFPDEPEDLIKPEEEPDQTILFKKMDK